MKSIDPFIELSEEEYKDRLKKSTTLYIGNLSFYTVEAQLLELFSQCGQVVNLIMGLNKQTMMPCGFCFIQYATRSEAKIAVSNLSGCILDGRQIRVDWDQGFEPHRQFGRGKTGGQVRDEMRHIINGHRDEDRPVQAQALKNRFEDRRHGGGGRGRGHYDRGTDRGNDRGDRGDRGNDRENFARKRTYRDREENNDEENGNEENQNDGMYKRRRFNNYNQNPRFSHNNRYNDNQQMDGGENYKQRESS